MATKTSTTRTGGKKEAPGNSRIRDAISQVGIAKTLENLIVEIQECEHDESDGPNHLALYRLRLQLELAWVEWEGRHLKG